MEEKPTSEEPTFQRGLLSTRTATPGRTSSSRPRVGSASLQPPKWPLISVHDGFTAGSSDRPPGTRREEDTVPSVSSLLPGPAGGDRLHLGMHSRSTTGAEATVRL